MSWTHPPNGERPVAASAGLHWNVLKGSAVVKGEHRIDGSAAAIVFQNETTSCAVFPNITTFSICIKLAEMTGTRSDQTFIGPRAQRI
jgi:hypothetical protein